MKVKSLHQAIEELLYGDKQDDNLLNGLTKIYNFYSQPFTPELITKFFKGWEEDCYASNKVKLWHCNHQYKFDVRNNIAIYSAMDSLWVVRSTNVFPSTLDDFIRDCQRAGIELDWL